MLSQISFSLFAQSAQQQSECPPAGASQEVNEAAPSLAAPSASGQQAGTPLAYEGVFEPLHRLAIRQLQNGVYGAYWDDWQIHGCALDAPDFLPSGSHRSFDLGAYVQADGYGHSRDYL